jgi:hypothetical protein
MSRSEPTSPGRPGSERGVNQDKLPTYSFRVRLCPVENFFSHLLCCFWCSLLGLPGMGLVQRTVSWKRLCRRLGRIEWEKKWARVLLELYTRVSLVGLLVV